MNMSTGREPRVTLPHAIHCDTRRCGIYFGLVAGIFPTEPLLIALLLVL